MDMNEELSDTQWKPIAAPAARVVDSLSKRLQPPDNEKHAPSRLQPRKREEMEE